jgi:hypothetical protein
MAFARTLFMLLGVLGVLLLGAVPPAMADSPPPPCHEIAAMGHGDSAPQPDKPMKSMACCVACIAAPAIAPPDRSGVAVRPSALKPAARALPVGLRLAPETGPPKA